MTGTAATMDIEENMAIALRRGEKRTLRWGVSREDRELFRESYRRLDWVGGSYDQQGRSSVRWSASGYHTFDGGLKAAEASVVR